VILALNLLNKNKVMMRRRIIQDASQTQANLGIFDKRTVFDDKKISVP